MCSTKDNNAAQQTTSSLSPSCIINIAEDIQYRFVSFSAQPIIGCTVCKPGHIISDTADMHYGKGKSWALGNERNH